MKLKNLEEILYKESEKNVNFEFDNTKKINHRNQYLKNSNMLIKRYT